MMIKERLEELGYKLPAPPAEAGNYIAFKEFGNSLVYVSGTGGDAENFKMNGRIGKELSIEDGQRAAEATMLNILAALYNKYGTLDNIKSFVKLLVFVACDKDFYEQPAVANGASDLLVKVFGEAIGKPARSAIGVYVLPENIPVEIECIVELK